MNVLDRFQAKYVINPVTGCWEWIAGKFGNGYGAFKINGKTIGAHCASFRLFKGAYSNWVLHSCDNPLCVNPDHLFDGTHTDNMRDKVQKGRGNFARGGDRHTVAKLNPEDVVAIRASELSQQKLADQYGVCQAAIWKIKNRKTWRHLP